MLVVGSYHLAMPEVSSDGRAGRPTPRRGRFDVAAGVACWCAALALVVSFGTAWWGSTQVTGLVARAVEDAAYHWDGSVSAYRDHAMSFYHLILVSAAVFAPIQAAVGTWLLRARSVHWPRVAVLATAACQLCLGLWPVAVQQIGGTDSGIIALTSSAAVGSIAVTTLLSLGGVLLAGACSVVAFFLVPVATLRDGFSGRDGG